MLYVNGQKIDDALIQQEMERMRPEYDPAFAEMEESQRENQLRDWSRENVIERELLRQAAQEHKSLASDADAKSVLQSIYQKNGGREQFLAAVEGGAEREPHMLAEIKANLQMDRFVQKLGELKDEPGDNQIRAFYDQHAADFVRPEMIHACHIIKHLQSGFSDQGAQDAMHSILQRVRSGVDFHELAREVSDCPQNGGDLGFFPRGAMVEEFEEVVFSLPPGGVSHVFQSRFGLHIAKVLERKPSEPMPFEEAKGQVRERLMQQLQHDRLIAFIDARREKAIVEDRPD